MRTWSTFWNVKHAPLHAFLPLGLSQVGGANRVIFQLTDTCFKADAGGFCHSCPLELDAARWYLHGPQVDGVSEMAKQLSRCEEQIEESWGCPDGRRVIIILNVLVRFSFWLRDQLGRTCTTGMFWTHSALRENAVIDTESTKGIPSDQIWSLDVKDRWFPSDFGTDRSFKLSCKCCQAAPWRCQTGRHGRAGVSAGCGSLV